MGAKPPGHPRTAVPPSDPAVNEGHHTTKPAVSSVFAGQLLDILIQLFRAQNSRKRARRAPMCPSRWYLTKPQTSSQICGTTSRHVTTNWTRAFWISGFPLTFL